MKNNFKEMNKDKILNIVGWSILAITVVSLFILSIVSSILGFKELADSNGIGGIPLSLEYAGAIFIATVFSIGVITLLVYFFLWGPLTKGIDSRKEKIENNIQEASMKNKLAESNFKESLKETKSAKIEAKEIIANSKKVANEEKKNILDSSKIESTKILENTREQINKEKKAMRNEVKNEILSTSLLAAEKIIEKEIDSEANKKMIEELISKLD